MHEWDESKRASNLAKHGVDFAALREADWKGAFTSLQAKDGEARFLSIAPISGRLYVIVWTWRDDRRRIISLRKANLRERQRYAVHFAQE